MNTKEEILAAWDLLVGTYRTVQHLDDYLYLCPFANDEEIRAFCLLDTNGMRYPYDIAKGQ